MAERGKHSKAHVNAGSNTTIKTGKGSLYTAVLTGPAGAVALLADSTSIGNPVDMNSTSVAGTITRIGPLAAAGSLVVPFSGVGLDTGLTVSATSNASLAVEYE